MPRFAIGDRVCRKVPSLTDSTRVGIVLSVWPHHKEINRFYYEVQFDRIAMYQESQLEPAPAEMSSGSDAPGTLESDTGEDLLPAGHSPPT